MFSLQVTWEEFLKIIKEEAGSQVVETWFKAVIFETWEPSTQTATLHMPNQFVLNWVREHYTELLKTHLCRLLHVQAITLKFVTAAQAQAQHQTNSPQIVPASVLRTNDSEKPVGHPAPRMLQERNGEKRTNTLPIRRPQAQPTTTKKNNASNILNQKYQFDTFIVGPSNSLAQAASYAVSQKLGGVYNPLFIYGATGLGKTHLLHAVGNEVKKKNNRSVVRYETADKFMNDFIHSIRFDKSMHFRERYKKVDVWLIDDVQFFSNKEQTQEMFFHIFNSLYERQKQIILSSDTFPKEIKGLQNRLKSRMGWGLVVDIQVPDLETKVAILAKKAVLHEMNLPDEVAHYIASRVLSNIRELEGSLVRVGAFSSLTNQPITIELAKKVLLHLPEEKQESVMLNNVLSSVSKHFGISTQEIRSKKRHKTVASVRQITFYLMKKMTICSLQTIGAYIGGRDHSTVIHAISRVEALKAKDLAFAQKLKTLEQEILCG